jgi:hypothetical protein
MMLHAPALCFACKRFRKDTVTCEAFPDAIPDEIIMFAGDHRTPIDGDGGVVFEQDTTAAAREAFEDWRLTQP